jgi:replication-associated recombination protein RarA
MKLPFPTPLTEKYRPRLVEDFVGLVKPKRILEAFIEKPYESAWVFKGKSGVGKTTMALAVAEQINAELHHIPSRTCDLEMVDNVTRMCHSGAFNFWGPNKGKPCDWHVVLVDEADQMTGAAQNSLLSKLDATASPPRTIWIFTCNSTQAFEDRFLSRCRLLEFDNESLEGELENYLRIVYRKEGGKHPLNLADIAKAANYNARDAVTKIELELMIGTNRKGLPSEEIKIIENHTHSCKKCHKPWKHQPPLCELPFLTVCPECGGSQTVGQERAKKAWVTIKAKAVEEARQRKKKPA